MKHISYTLILIMALLPISTFAQNTRVVEFDKFEAEYEDMFSKMERDFERFSDSIDTAYDEYVQKLEVEYAAFEKGLEQTWGKGNVLKSDRYNWVEYDNDYKSRSIVDFKNGDVKIEVALTDDEVKNKEIVDQRLIESIERLLSSKAKTVEYKSNYIPQTTISSTPIIEDIVDPKKYGIDSAKSDKKKSELAKAIIETEKPIIKKASNGNHIVTVDTKLSSNYLPKSAKRYETLVLKNAKRFNVDPSLIWAVMEAESSFHPTAGSKAGALGLMQIVPRSAGRDMYKKLYGEDRILNQSYLFQPDKNIEMGVAYLDHLATNYFSKVTDPRCRDLCVIAAYNTGPGNVSRAMAGHTKVSKVIPLINAMSYDELYQHFKYNLPLPETRKYIVLVTSKRGKYR